MDRVRREAVQIANNNHMTAGTTYPRRILIHCYYSTCFPMAYRVNGQVKTAVMLLEHVVAFREGMLAEDHPDQLASQHAPAGGGGKAARARGGG